MARLVNDKFAMIPESLIVSGISATALRLYCYLDLRQGTDGYAVRGSRWIGKKLGVDARTVRSAARELKEAGWIRIRSGLGTQSHTYEVSHNPSRRRRSPRVKGIPVPHLASHDPVTFVGNPSARDAPDMAQDVHLDPADPGAEDAPGSRSPRSRRSGVTQPASDGMCQVCGLRTTPFAEGMNSHAGFCACPF